ncbi:unnamed protein product, partial [Prorocentrum cordatum]
MAVEVDFECRGCRRELCARRPLRDGLLWPRSFRHRCPACPELRYSLLLKANALCYSVSCAGPASRPPDSPSTRPSGRRRPPTVAPRQGPPPWRRRSPRIAVPAEARRGGRGAAAEAAVASLPRRPVRGGLAERRADGLDEARRAGGARQRRLSEPRCPLRLRARSAGAEEQAAGRGSAAARRGAAAGAARLAAAGRILRRRPRRVRTVTGAGPAAPVRRPWPAAARGHPGPRGGLGGLRPLAGLRAARPGAAGCGGSEVAFGSADVARPLDSVANAGLLESAGRWDLLVFSYVLVENMQAVRAGGFAFLRDLLAVAPEGAVCVVRGLVHPALRGARGGGQGVRHGVLAAGAGAKWSGRSAAELPRHGAGGCA